MQGDDPRRLAAVRGSGLMVGAGDPSFDRAARTAALCTGAPVALVSVVGAARQHFIGQHGLEGEVAERRGTPISASCCRLVVEQEAPLVVDDAAVHEAITALDPIPGLPIGAYLGVPLRDADGVLLGAVCAIDVRPRAWTHEDVVALEDVAGFLQAHLTLRAITRELRGRAIQPVRSARGQGRTASCRSLPVPHRRR